MSARTSNTRIFILNFFLQLQDYKVNKAKIQLTLDYFVAMDVVRDGHKLVSDMELGGLGHI